VDAGCSVSRLTVHVTPRAGRDEILGWSDDGAALRIRVRAAPADGAANEAVARTLARALGLPPSALRIVSGASARRKIIDIPLDATDLRLRLAATGQRPPRTA